MGDVIAKFYKLKQLAFLYEGRLPAVT